VVVAWAATNGLAAGDGSTQPAGVDEPIGYALVEVMEGPEDTWVSGDRLAELQTFAVAPAWRGRGIGTLLLDRVDAELAKLDIRDVLVAVLEGNSNARRLYERRGFRPVMTTLARFGTQSA
jgi:ribosomal protein S18 acetylase RimI-like enzyme